MGGDFILLAAAETFQKEVEAAKAGGQIETHGVLIAVSIAVALGIILFVAVYLHHRRKQAKEGQRNRISKTAPKPIKPVASNGDDSSEDGSDPERRRVRKRRRKRDHRPRNPTLDKTGGLPPLRPDDELPKF
jgi:hypothetical protein